MNSMKTPAIPLFLIFLAIFSLNALAQETTASITVFVVDDQNYLIENAKVMINCDNGMKQEFFTDEYGYLLIEEVPFGNCTLNAVSDRRLGSMTFAVEEPANYQAIIIIEKQQQSLLLIAGIIIAIILIGITAAAYLFYGKKKSEQKSRVLEALTENERKAMEFLLKEKEFSPQNRIRHNTGMPKATLSRAMQALESKNLIEAKEFGTLKKFRAKKI